MHRSMLRVVSAAALALCSGAASAQTLLYSFETLYSGADNPVPDPLGTLPDGFTNNGGGTTITQDVFGATQGAKSMKFQQIEGPTFTGARTALNAPFDIINDPTTFAISLDLTIKAGEEYT